MRHRYCFQSQKHVISGLNEKVDKRITSDKSGFNSCLHLVCFKEWGVVLNVITTCWMSVIRLGNCPDGKMWFLKKLRMLQARNLDFKSYEH